MRLAAWRRWPTTGSSRPGDRPGGAPPCGRTPAAAARPDERRPRGSAPYWSRRPGHRVAYIDATGSARPGLAPSQNGEEPMAEKTRGIRIEQGPKRVRAYLAGELVADTKTPFLVWEWPYYPTYYFPAADVCAELVPSGQTEHSPSRGEGQLYHLKVAGAAADGAALRYPDSPIEALRGLVRLDWPSMSEWFEEDEPVYVHPRDPYRRVDILASSRHVRVEIDGVTVADSGQPRILFETGLPPRYYLPLTDLRMDLLRPSDTQTHCPYKGTAAYW